MASVPESLISEGLWENVEVSEITDVEHFTVKLQSSEPEFIKMMIDIQKRLGRAAAPPQNMHVGKHVIAKFSFDNQWYRGIVKSVDDDGTIDVLYMDYGNMESMQADTIADLPEQYTQLPSQGVSCRLNRIDYSQPISSSHSEAFKAMLLNRKFTAKFIQCLPDDRVWLVELLHPTGNVNDWFGKRINRLTSSEQFTAPSELPYPHNPGLKAAKELTNGHARSQTIILNNKLSTQASSKCPGFKGLVVFSNGPAEFWVHKDSDATSVEEITAKLADHCASGSTLTPMTSLSIGQLCAALYSEDETWYRGEIREIRDGEVQVYFIDYGNTELVNSASIAELPAYLQASEGFAHKCALANIQPLTGAWTAQANTYFADLTMADTVNVEIADALTPRLSVKLTLATGESVADMLCQVGYGAPLSPTLQRPAAPVGLPATVAAYPSVELPTQRSLKATCVFMKSPHEFYCQLLSSSVKLEQLMDEIADQYADYTVEKLCHVTPGTPCCALYSVDESWYRATVIQDNGAKIKVFFVDYGNYEDVDRAAVRELLPSLLSLAPQAHQCHLHECSPIDRSTTWSPAAISRFEALIMTGDALSINLVINKQVGKEYHVTVTTEEGDVKQLLVQEGLALDSEIRVTTTPDRLSMSHNTTSPCVIHNEYTQLSVESGQRMLVYISWLLHPGEFWVQAANSESVLEKLMNDVSECAENSHPIAVPNVGNVCIAKYETDEQWYRGQITTVHSDSAQVLFVDYGNSETISFSNLHAMTSKLMDTPAQALKCSITGVVPKEGEAWNAKSHDIMEENMADGVYCTFLAKHKDTYLVEVTFGEKQSSLKEVLIESGVARFNDRTASLASDRSHGSQRSGSSSSRSRLSRRAASSDRRPSSSSTNSAVGLGVDAAGDRSMVNEPMVSIPRSTLASVGAAVGSVVNITVVHVNSLDKLYCQVKGRKEEMDAMYDDMSKFYHSGTALRVHSPIINACYVVQFSEDNEWYRARVTGKSGSHYEVFYVDYGNTEQVAADKFYHLSDEYGVMPEQALMCCLDGAPVTVSEAVLDKFKQLVTYKELPAKICSAQNDLVSVDILVNGVSLSSLYKSTKPKHYPSVVMATGEFRGYVTEGTTANQFFVQRADDTESIQKTMAKVAQVASISAELVEPRVGQACLAKFTDGIWYRAKVKSTGDSLVTVLFVDYGNSEQVTGDNVRDISKCLASLAPFAWPCKLARVDIEEAGQLAEWTEEAELTVQVKAVSDNIATVSLVKDDGEVADSVFSAASFSTSDYQSQPFTDVVQVEVVPDPVPEVKCIKLPRLATGSYPAYISHCSQLDHFYVQLSTASSLLEDMSKKVAIAAEHGSLLTSITLGSACLAQYSEDDVWYRARIEENCSDQSASVVFVDYGNSENVPSTKLKKITDALLSDEALAIPCKMMKGDTSADAVARFLAWTQEEEVTLQVVGHCETIHLVDIVTDQGSYSQVIESPSKFSHFQSLPENGSNPSSLQESPARPSDKKYLPINITLGKYSCYVSHVDENYIFYLHIANASEQLESLIADLQELCINAEPEVYSPVDQACVTQYAADGAWYRAKVTEAVEGSGTTTVLFVDYGNSETVRNSQLKVISKDMRDIPPMAIPCICKDKDIISKSPDVIVQEYCESEHIVEFLTDEPPYVITFGLEATAQQLGDVQSEVSFSAEPGAKERTVVDPLTLRFAVSPELTLTSGVIARIGHANDPQHFYCQFGTEQSLDEIASLICDTYTEHTNLTIPPEHCLPGQHCVAQYSVDEQWYRGIVLTSPVQELCKVFFVDYGNVESVHIHKICYLTAALAKFPKQANRCTLHGVYPLQGSQWDDAALSRFHELVNVEQNYSVEILKVKALSDDESVATVSLTTSGVSIAELLVEAGFCRSLQAPDASASEFCALLLEEVNIRLTERFGSSLSVVTEKMSSVVKSLAACLETTVANLTEGADSGTAREVVSHAVRSCCAAVLDEPVLQELSLTVRDRSKLQIEINDLMSVLLETFTESNTKLVEMTLGESDDILPSLPRDDDNFSLPESSSVEDVEFANPMKHDYIEDEFLMTGAFLARMQSEAAAILLADTPEHTPGHTPEHTPERLTAARSRYNASFMSEEPAGQTADLNSPNDDLLPLCFDELTRLSSTEEKQADYECETLNQLPAKSNTSLSPLSGVTGSSGRLLPLSPIGEVEEPNPVTDITDVISAERQLTETEALSVDLGVEYDCPVNIENSKDLVIVVSSIEAEGQPGQKNITSGKDDVFANLTLSPKEKFSNDVSVLQELPDNHTAFSENGNEGSNKNSLPAQDCAAFSSENSKFENIVLLDRSEDNRRYKEGYAYDCYAELSGFETNLPTCPDTTFLQHDDCNASIVESNSSDEMVDLQEAAGTPEVNSTMRSSEDAQLATSMSDDFAASLENSPEQSNVRSFSLDESIVCGLGIPSSHIVGTDEVNHTLTCLNLTLSANNTFTVTGEEVTLPSMLDDDCSPFTRLCDNSLNDGDVESDADKKLSVEKPAYALMELNREVINETPALLSSISKNLQPLLEPSQHDLEVNLDKQINSLERQSTTDSQQHSMNVALSQDEPISCDVPVLQELPDNHTVDVDGSCDDFDFSDDKVEDFHLSIKISAVTGDISSTTFENCDPEADNPSSEINTSDVNEPFDEIEVCDGNALSGQDTPLCSESGTFQQVIALSYEPISLKIADNQSDEKLGEWDAGEVITVAQPLSNAEDETFNAFKLFPVLVDDIQADTNNTQSAEQSDTNNTQPTEQSDTSNTQSAEQSDASNTRPAEQSPQVDQNLENFTGDTALADCELIKFQQTDFVMQKESSRCPTVADQVTSGIHLPTQSIRDLHKKERDVSVSVGADSPSTSGINASNINEQPDEIKGCDGNAFSGQYTQSCDESCASPQVIALSYEPISLIVTDNQPADQDAGEVIASVQLLLSADDVVSVDSEDVIQSSDNSHGETVPDSSCIESKPTAVCNDVHEQTTPTRIDKSNAVTDVNRDFLPECEVVAQQAKVSKSAINVEEHVSVVSTIDISELE